MSGPVVLITGASRGIGRACAQAFAAAGYRLVLVARHIGGLDGLAPELRAPVQVLAGDVADPALNERAVRMAVDTYGRLDCVVANAAVTLQKPVDMSTAEDIEELLAVNVRGLIHLAQASHGPLARSRGSFLVVGSKAGLVPVRNAPVYVATKAAAVQFARALALDWAPDGVRVNALCPGSIDTRLLEQYLATQDDPDDARARLAEAIPLGRIGLPEDCAAAAVFLASPGASFITGIAMPIDGGFTAQ